MGAVRVQKDYPICRYVIDKKCYPHCMNVFLSVNRRDASEGQK